MKSVSGPGNAFYKTVVELDKILKGAHRKKGQNSFQTSTHLLGLGKGVSGHRSAAFACRLSLNKMQLVTGLIGSS